MGELESDLRKLLDGEILSVTGDADIQIESIFPDGQDRPIVKRTITYIVMGLIFDDRGRMILIQEAKQSCYGEWYLPAGRVEPGENLIDAVKREVKEEAGVDFIPHTVMNIKLHNFNWIKIGFIGTCLVKREVLEEAGVVFEPQSVINLQVVGNLNWFRVCYVGKAAGGQLKTLDQKDSESLQAGWFTPDDIRSGQVKLRHKDFFRSMELAERFISVGPEEKHPFYSIGIQPYPYILHRPVIVRKTASGLIEVLCNIKRGNLPYCKANPQDSLSATMATILMKVFKIGSQALKLKGLLTLEHCGIPAREHDGLCMTTVYKVPKKLHEGLDQVINNDYAWIKLTNSDLIEQLNKRALSKTEQLLIPII